MKIYAFSVVYVAEPEEEINLLAICKEAISNGDGEFAQEIKSMSELPAGWHGTCLPYGDDNEGKCIGEYFDWDNERYARGVRYGLEQALNLIETGLTLEQLKMYLKKDLGVK